MRKKIKSIKQSVPSLRRTSRLGILPFTERPSEQRTQSGAQPGSALEASDLFSLFTANIIREETLFTR